MMRFLALLTVLALAAAPTAWAQKKPVATRPAERRPDVSQPTPGGPTDFAAADAHADATPESAERSVSALAAYLAQAGPDERTRARAVYRWVTGNIAYDVSGFRTGNYGDLSPAGVLRRRTAVCQGYAQLAEALGEAMGLEIEVVSGWSKGYGYTSGQRFEGPTNHAWNAVRVDGQWQLMDPTWGAGYLDGGMQFVRRFQEHYFLTAPQAFVFDHLPQDRRWQLLDRPISSSEYAELAYLRPMFFLAGFQIGSHDRARIDATDRTTVTLRVTRPVQMAAQVLDAASDQRLEGNWAFVQVGAEDAQVQAAFPRAGDYILRVFAKPAGTEGTLQWVVDYRVEASAGARTGAFPTAFGEFGNRRSWLVEPLTGTLDAGRTYPFRLRTTGAVEMAAVAGGEWTHFTRDGDDWVADVTAAAGTITVFAKYDPDQQFQGLLQYTGR